MREFRVGHDGGGIRIDQHHLVSFGTQRLARLDRKSTRLNSSHSQISYAVFCLKKKKPQLASLPHKIEAQKRSASGFRRDFVVLVPASILQTTGAVTHAVRPRR